MARLSIGANESRDERDKVMERPGLIVAPLTPFNEGLEVDEHALRRQIDYVIQDCGATMVVAAPGAALGLAGWTVLGLGLATVAPTLLGAAPRIGGTQPALAIAAVTTIGYLGSFTGPPLIGILADATSLSTALAALIVLSAILAAGARRVLG